MNVKVPVFSVIGNSVGFIFSSEFFSSKHTWKFLLLFAVSLQISGFLGGFLNRYVGLDKPDLLIQLFMLAVIFIFAPFAISIHRNILLEESFPEKSFSNFFSKKNMYFGLVSFLIALPMGLAQYGVPIIFSSPFKYIIPDSLFLPIIIGWWGLIILYSIFMVRVMVILPLLALDEHKKVSECFSYTSKNTWRLWVTNLIFGVVTTIILRFSHFLLHSIFGLNDFASMLIIDVVGAFTLFLYISLTVSIVTHWAGHFIKYDKIPRPSSMTTSLHL